MGSGLTRPYCEYGTNLLVGTLFTVLRQASATTIAIVLMALNSGLILNSKI